MITKILDGLTNKIKDKKASTILFIIYKSVYILVIVAIIAYVLVKFLSRINKDLSDIPANIFMVFIILITILHMALRVAARRAVPLALYDCIDFDKYIYCLKYISANSSGKKAKKLNRYYLKLGEAEVLFYKGDFEEALKKLKEINIEDFNTGYQLPYYNLCFYIHLFLKNIEEAKTSTDLFKRMNQTNTSKERKKLVTTLSNNHNATYEIYIENKPNSYSSFHSGNVNSLKLAYLYHNLYFNALNQKLLGNNEGAKNLFEELSKENEELFFVQEAKKELENLKTEEEIL